MKTKQFDKKFHYLNNKHNDDANFVDEQTPRIYEKLAEMGISDPKHHYRINKFIETHNLTDKYPAKDLYVFSKKVVLLNADSREIEEELYIKISIDEKGKIITTISFHPAEHCF